MTFRIENRVGVKASAERIWDLIADLSGWSQWNPVDVDVEGALAIGGTLILTERIPGLPDRRVTAAIRDWQPYAQLIWGEKRGWQFSSVRYYEIEQLEVGCIVANGQIFSGLRGESAFAKQRKILKAAFAEVGEAIRLRVEG